MLATVAAAGLAGEACADVIDLLAGGAVVHDTNIFKRPDAVSDTTKSAYLGLRVDKTYSLQRFLFDITRTAYRHGEDLSYLDFNGVDYRGSWLWSLTPRINGSLIAARSEAQVPYFDFNATQRNVRVSTDRSFSLDASVWRGLHLLGGGARLEQTSSAPFLAQADYKLYRVEGGLKYVFAAGNSLAFLQRTGRGEYINRVLDPNVPLDTKYKQNETELQATWLMTARSTFAGRLTRLERRHENLHELDSSGYAGDATLTWAATGKLDVGLSARRSLVPYFDAFATHRVDKTLAFAPRWQAASNLLVSFGASRTHSDFLGGQASAGEPRRDNYSAVELGASWTPIRKLALGASVQRHSRSSTDPAVVFDGKITRLSAALTY